VLGAGAGEIHRGGTRGVIHRDGHLDLLAVVHRIAEAPVTQPVDDAAHALLGVALDVAHVGGDNVDPLLVADAQQLAPPPRRWRRPAP
jgi:hypothetical protein